MSYPIHIWTSEEINELEEITFNEEDFVPFKEVMNKLKSGEPVTQDDFFEFEAESKDVWFYGLVQTPEGILLCEIYPGVGYCDVDIKDLFYEDELMGGTNLEENLIVCLFHILLENPEHYKNKSESFSDVQVKVDIRNLRLHNLVQKLKGVVQE